MIASNRRAVKVTFDQFLKIVVSPDSNTTFTLVFTPDGGLDMTGSRFNGLYVENIANEAKFLMTIDELRLKFIKDRKSAIPEIKTYLKSVFDDDDCFTVFEYTDIEEM